MKNLEIGNAIDDCVRLATLVRSLQKDIQTLPTDVFRLAKELGLFIKYSIFETNQPGWYIPPSGENDDIHMVAISATDDIARQRFTMAHEIAHYLRFVYAGINLDVQKSDRDARDQEERFANNFASHLLVPDDIIQSMSQRFITNGHVPFEHVNELAWHFGVTPLAMVCILAYRYELIEGDTDPKILKQRLWAYRDENADYDIDKFIQNKVQLYSQAIDAYPFNLFSFDPHRERRRIINYIYNELVGEGIRISIQEVAELYVDSELYKDEEKYIGRRKERFIEALGQCHIYRTFMNEELDYPSIHDIRRLHQTLYKYAPYPEMAGRFRTTNPIVTQGNPNIPDFTVLNEQILELSKGFNEFMKKACHLSHSQYLLQILNFHHRLTVLHPFSDGNGRVARAFVNWLLKKRQIPIVFFAKEGGKSEYLNSLSSADHYEDYRKIHLLYMKSIIMALAD